MTANTDSIARDLDSMLPHVTAEAVERGLTDCSLTLVEGRNVDWLAVAVRRSMAMTVRSHSEGPNQKSATKARKELLAARDKAGKAWQSIFGLPDEAKEILSRYAFEKGPEVVKEKDGLELSRPALMDRYTSAVQELEWLHTFLSQAYRTTSSAKPNWRSNVAREMRVERALYLFPVFRAAFDREPTANPAPYDALYTASDFMRFYESMMILVFSDDSIPDLPGVIWDALKRDKLERFRIIRDRIL
jgi:hypothetical protein